MLKLNVKNVFRLSLIEVVKRNVSIFRNQLQISNLVKEDCDVVVPENVDLDVCDGWNVQNADIDKIKTDLIKTMRVIPDFISETEENALFAEVEPFLKKMRYEFDHWDDAIHGFRETERSTWTGLASEALKRSREFALVDSSSVPLAHIHVLDLDGKGYIKPHVDAVRFCGDTVAGICLLSPAVMRLKHTANIDLFADFLLPRRCFYIMKDSSRYDFTHEILKTELSYFKKKYVERGRRISLISRSEPDPTKKSY